ncbi:nuclear transport factor 2 family protein [Sphingorhabdus sp. Alg231-15]|uniref:nuclear transport factor 2 family protein n=1 Tax=Sphingorhabdus sp. Alg231-15 TaxID=1922222 RepID=UPI000D54E9D8
MPSRKRVEQFVDAVVHGDHAKAIEDFYHADASMQENLAPPRRSRENLVAHEKRALANLQEMKTHPPETILVDGDNVVIVWTFDATDKNGVTRRLHEITHQIWSADHILQERFVYDSATAWQIVEKD